jgi:hypothetical protein
VYCISTSQIKSTEKISHTQHLFTKNVNEHTHRIISRFASTLPCMKCIYLFWFGHLIKKMVLEWMHIIFETCFIKKNLLLQLAHCAKELYQQWQFSVDPRIVWYIQDEHKVFPWLQTFYYKKTTWNTNIFFTITCVCCKKKLQLSYILKKEKNVCIPHSFLVINVCNQGKTLCSPYIHHTSQE